MNSAPDNLSIEQCVSLACLIEAIAAKPGNVHRGADFESLTFTDFAVSSVAIGPAIASAREDGVGRAALSAVQATRTRVATNTNLGTVLLLAPLAAVPRDQPLGTGIASVLADLDSIDAELVYTAIKLAEPGGLGDVDEMDVAGSAPPGLLTAMGLAADRDLVARQYVNSFREVLDVTVPWLQQGLAQGWTLTSSVVHTHIRLMRDYPDSLIARKCGKVIAHEAAVRAARILESGPPESPSYQESLADLDFWLRSDGQRRNPGTTADLIAAGLFVLLRDKLIEWPVQ